MATPNFNIGENSKTFSIIQDNRLASAELSKIDYDLIIQVDELEKLPLANYYYFNRLIVDPKLRGLGLSNQLMKQVIEWANQNSITILLDINPYGPLSYNDLEKFYMKFGFKPSETGIFHMIYKKE
jgi:GNAT superfamily N-acetyltransferase